MLIRPVKLDRSGFPSIFGEVSVEEYDSPEEALEEDAVGGELTASSKTIDAEVFDKEIAVAIRSPLSPTATNSANPVARSPDTVIVELSPKLTVRPELRGSLVVEDE